MQFGQLPQARVDQREETGRYDGEILQPGLRPISGVRTTLHQPGDIEKHHSIAPLLDSATLVDRRHRKWQQILWRELPNEPLQVYELKTVTYGMACSPFNAIRALRQCANDNYEVIYDPSRAAAARHSILYNFYVDDYLDSVDSDELAITRQLILGKWNSNSTHVLSAITGTTPSASELELNNSTTKVLGLYWDPVSDELFFKVGLVDDTSMHTKRKVLSDVAKLYDPTGVLAPVVVVAKLFIQDLWKAGLPWDAELPPELLSS
ncbi:uncharacterized protein LOC120781523 [Bactrocera tryoni]|uniref:uncharacterized protein LOC120781523 n=1 Tax=Bactrocera tryoni TaxID=59916 RepID=UPI001A96C13B|nr:uncharacterized protein LOC120781523 [Bactrocera tryoni]